MTIRFGSSSSEVPSWASVGVAKELAIKCLKSVLALVLIWACLRPARGESVSEEQAKSAVRGWLRAEQTPMQTTLGQQIQRVETFKTAAGTPLFYVVYLDPEGFVLVSADDLIEPIIGFLSSGQFTPSDDNPLYALVRNDLSDRNLRAKNKALQSASAQGSSLAAKSKWGQLWSLEKLAPGEKVAGIASVSDVWVAPLTQTLWGQSTVVGNACYNYYTPPYAEGSANNCVCGCVATAMAQLMRYWQYPSAGVGTSSFTIYVNGSSQIRNLRGGNGTGGHYAWDNMILDPRTSSTLAQRQAIGALCADAGVSINTSYSATLSLAHVNKVKNALINTFKYSNAVVGYNQNQNIGFALNTMINPNLDAGCPVLLGIRSASGEGHAIVADGYGYNQSTPYHHLNLGWADSATAWYNLPSINTYNSVEMCVYNIWTNGSGEIISGRIMDSSGVPIAGVGVTATRSGGGTYTATSNAQGIYALAKIPASSEYTVRATKAGFSFADQIISTWSSVDGTVYSGNQWCMAFISAAAVPSYHVTFDAQWGLPPNPASVVVTNGLPYGTLATTMRAGYSFGGWWTGINGAGSLVIPSTVVALTANQTLYAKWVGNPYTVTFDAQGGSQPNPATISVINGLPYDKLAMTTRSGYSFGGWCTSTNHWAGSMVMPETIVTLTANQTLYATWFANMCGVTFDAQGGTLPTPEITVVTYGLPYGTLATTMRAGYTFGGWWTGINGSGTLVTPETVVTITSVHQTLYAKWVVEHSIMVTFDPRGGMTPTPASVMVTSGLAYGTLATTMRAGYSFGGWWTGINGTGAEVTSGTVVSLTAAQTLYAKWVGNTYMLLFDARSGTPPNPATKTVTNDMTYGTLPMTTWAGHTFGGWWTGTDGSGTEVTPSMVVSLTENRALFAKWVGNSYLVTFDAQGGVASIPASVMVTNGLPYGTLATTTRAGYTFSGWWTGINGSGSEVTAATLVTIISPQTLYAKWTGNPPPFVMFDPQGGTTPNPVTKTVTNGLPYGTLATTMRAGYSFGGWWTGINGAGSLVIPSTVVTLTAAQTLYAKWVGDTYMVTFDAQGGSQPNPATKTVTNDMTYGTLPMTTWAGHTFGGWWTFSGGAGTAITPSTPVSLMANQTHYAKWAGLGAITILNETFEGNFPDDNDWILYGSPTWADTSWDSYAGGWAGYCAASTNPVANAHGPYSPNMDAWMVYGPFSLADASAAQISLMQLYQCESGIDEVMYAVSTDGSQFYPGSYVYSGQNIGWDTNGWEAVTIDLANSSLGNLCGQSSVWFAIIFTSDGTIEHGGAYVDNIVIQKTVGGDRFSKTGPATLNGSVQNSITLAAGANLSGSFSYLARNGQNPNANVITIVGLVDYSGQWMGGTPQAVYAGIPSQAGSSGTAAWSNLALPEIAGPYALRFKAYWSMSESQCIDSFMMNPPTLDQGVVEGLVATIAATGVTPKPDLIVQSISHSPANPNPGDIVTFRVTLKNQGTSVAQSIFNTGFWSNRSSIPAISTTPELNQDYLGGMMTGETHDVLFTLTAPAAGTYTSWAYVDCYQGASEIDESNENNNAGPTPSGYVWTVGGGTPKPDLIVQSITHSPASPNPGDNVTFTVTLKNQGSTVVAGVFNTGFWPSRMSAPDLSSLPDESQDYHGGIAAGSTYAMTFTVTAPVVGSYSAWAYVDCYMGTSEIDEGNEGNNAGPTPAGHPWTVGGPTPGEDAWDPLDNVGSGATEIVPVTPEGGHGPHTLGNADQYDWFKVYLYANVLYNFNSAGGSGDTFAELYADPNGFSLVQQDDDSGGNLQFSLSYLPGTDGWRFLRVRTFSLGSSASYSLHFRGSTPLGAAIEQPAWNWITYGPANWFGQTQVTHDGADAVQSGNISHSQSSWMKVGITGPGTLSFWWKVSSEAECDILGLWVDNEVTTTNLISGEVGWQLVHRDFSSGVHTAYWGYIKDNTVNAGSDCGWVDEVSWKSRGVLSDYNGDGTSDLGVFNPANGAWYVGKAGGGQITWNNQWGWRTAKPVPGDYDGDGKFDLAVFDTAGGYWYIKSLNGAIITWKNQWGWSTAKPVPGDYDGDGKSDQAIFDTVGGYWYIKGVSGNVITWKNQWGWSTAKPVPGDYNGDGKWDQAVFDTQGGYWYIKSVDSNSIAWKVQWGWSTAKPVPGDYNGDGKYDLAVFDTVGGYWYIRTVDGNVITWKNQWGWSTAKPIPGDYNGDGKFDLAVYDNATGFWYIKSLDGTVLAWAVQWGWPGATVPALGD